MGSINDLSAPRSAMIPPVPKTINFITSNANKLVEVRAILAAAGVSHVRLESKSLDLDEIQAARTEDVVRDKCRRAAAAVAALAAEPGTSGDDGDREACGVLVEDTCLEFEALGGLPGPYIKWFLQRLGHEGLNNLLVAYEDKTAQAVCTFAYSPGPGEEPVLFQGRTKGRIVPARGPGRFGWDPIFEYEGKTFAEMVPEEKNKVSHRFKALQKLQAWLTGEGVPDQ